MQYVVVFPGGEVKYSFGATFDSLKELVRPDECVVISDNTLANLYDNLFVPYHRTIAIPPGEEQKNWHTIEMIAGKLLQYEAHRNTFLLGIGGGVITDITGFIASVYMRGIKFGFVPTTLLGMVDAAIGGKNGVNMGKQKNFLGTIQQPRFIFYDLRFLDTLPETEWSNGFAEIIKYACLFDNQLFRELKTNDLDYYKNNREALLGLIQKCTNWKNNVVLQDEKETGIRKLLNFGHTAGHAFETLYSIPHGYGVALGMLVACMISETHCGLDSTVRKELAATLQQYKLPVRLKFNPYEVMAVLRMDKKRTVNEIDYITLNSIGHGEVRPLTFDAIQKALVSFSDVSDY